MYNIAEKEKEKLCVSSSSLEKISENLEAETFAAALLTKGAFTMLGGLCATSQGLQHKNKVVENIGYSVLALSFAEMAAACVIAYKSQ